ncbi:MAG: ZIP family metal transporter [Rhodoferax sp.]
MTLIAIVVGTLLAGIGSVWLAAMLSFGALARYTQHMLSMAAGALLSTAFLHLLPEAMESEAGAHDLFMVLLVGVVFFFLLDKAELWHHGHEHHHGDEDGAHGQGSGHDYGHAHAHAETHGHRGMPRMGGSWAVLAGDSVHCFGDGVLIASAFMAEWRLGALAALAVLAHEVPHHMGDLVVLREGSGNRRMALVKVSLAGAVTALGGVVGYWLLEQLRDYLPFFLVLASSSFIYVALADLIPQLQQRLGARQTLFQILWLVFGVLLVGTVSGLAH